jgi:hypothetical protein
MVRTHRIVLFAATTIVGLMGIFISCTSAIGQGALQADALVAGDKKAALSESAPIAAATEKKISLQGICTDQHSDPIPGARVRVFWLISNDEPLQMAAEVKSDEDGKFSIPGVAALPDDKKRAPGFTGIIVTATATGHVSTVKLLNAADAGWAALVLDDNPGTLSGIITDENGKPLQGAVVYQHTVGTDPIPELQSAVTDEQGRYAISDLTRWNSKDTERRDLKTGMVSRVTARFFEIVHPQYAHSRGSYAAIPQEVNISLAPPAVVEGQVIDALTGQPLANVPVSAQGVARSEWYPTRTNATGRYRLIMNKDHYNIWAEADERIAIAVNAIAAEPGKTITDVDIPMVKGGFVIGKVIDGATGKTLEPPLGQPQYVAHYGPARPRTGAGVTSTKIQDDGTYRLRVAPGHNYVYLMNGTASALVEVADGQEVPLDLQTGRKVPRDIEAGDPDLKLAARLRSEAREEDAEKERIAKGGQP